MNLSEKKVLPSIYLLVKCNFAPTVGTRHLSFHWRPAVKTLINNQTVKLSTLLHPLSGKISFIPYLLKSLIDKKIEITFFVAKQRQQIGFHFILGLIQKFANLQFQENNFQFQSLSNRRFCSISHNTIDNARSVFCRFLNSLKHVENTSIKGLREYCEEDM